LKFEVFNRVESLRDRRPYVNGSRSVEFSAPVQINGSPVAQVYPEHREGLPAGVFDFRRCRCICLRRRRGGPCRQAPPGFRPRCWCCGCLFLVGALGSIVSAIAKPSIVSAIAKQPTRPRRPRLASPRANPSAAFDFPPPNIDNHTLSAYTLNRTPKAYNQHGIHRSPGVHPQGIRIFGRR
jgi:hypothetical protein